MEIIKINSQNPDPKIIDYAVEILKHGGILVYPTDTSYGIGVDVTNPVAVNRLYKFKQREQTKPIAVIASSIEFVKENLAKIDDKQENILRAYFPGPFTFVLTPLSQEGFSHYNIGVRIPFYRITQLISNKLNLPYATTSANIAELPSCFSIADFIKQINQSDRKPDLILDAGKLPETLQSTVVDLTTDPPKILRHGAMEFKI